MRFSSIIVLLFFACIASAAPLSTTPHNDGISSRGLFDTFKNMMGSNKQPSVQSLPLCSAAIRDAILPRLQVLGQKSRPFKVLAEKAGVFKVFESHYKGEEVDVKEIDETATGKDTSAEAKQWMKAGYLLFKAYQIISGHHVAFFIIKHTVPRLTSKPMNRLMKEAVKKWVFNHLATNNGVKYLAKKDPENFLWRYIGTSRVVSLMDWARGWTQKALVHVMTGQPCRL